MSAALHEPFLDAARDHRLVVQRCSSCGHAQLPPLMRCERCDGRSLEWAEASGRATLASFTVLHRAPPEHDARVPYVYALVDLAEGPRIVTNVIGVEHEQLSIGTPLTVVFARTDGDDGQPWPEFAPLGPASKTDGCLGDGTDP
jgi:uncharacterized OB-fold protein